MRRDYIIIFILWMQEQRHRKVRFPVQDGRVRKWWAWDRNPGSLAPESMPVTTKLSGPCFKSAPTSPFQRALPHFPIENNSFSWAPSVLLTQHYFFKALLTADRYSLVDCLPLKRLSPTKAGSLFCTLPCPAHNRAQGLFWTNPNNRDEGMDISEHLLCVRPYGDLRDGPKMVLALQAFKRGREGPMYPAHKHPQAGDGVGPGQRGGRLSEQGSPWKGFPSKGSCGS